MKKHTPRTALFPGTFDPVTNGHLDLMKRSAKLFDRLVIGVAQADEKGVLFPLEERLEMIRAVTRSIPHIEVMPFRGLLVNFAARHKVDSVVRGLRAVSDFEFELQMALMNRKLRPGLETLFLMPSERYTYLNSTVVKEIARLGGNVSEFVPALVVKRLKARLGRRR